MFRYILTGFVALAVLIAVASAQVADTAQRPRPDQAEKSKQEKKEAELKLFVKTAASFASVQSFSPTFDLLTTDPVAHELALSKEQRTLVDKLSELTRGTIRTAILQTEINLNEPRDALDRRIKKEVSEIVAHAEKIATGGILTDKQATMLKAILVRSMGVRALLESDVAATLGLTKLQRDELHRRHLVLRSAYQYDPTTPAGPSLKSSNPDVAQAALQDVRGRIQQAEDNMWAVLTPPQLQKFQNLVSTTSQNRR